VECEDVKVDSGSTSARIREKSSPSTGIPPPSGRLGSPRIRQQVARGCREPRACAALIIDIICSLMLLLRA